MKSHWHVQRHDEDDDVYVTADVFTALEYAADELDRLSEHEHEGVHDYGGHGLFEEAYKALVRSERYAGIAANARNVHKQGTAPVEERAVHYQSTDESANRRKLDAAATRVVVDIMTGAPDGFSVWECVQAECAPTEDD